MNSNIVIQVDSMIDHKVYRDFCDFNSFTVGKRWFTMILGALILLLFAGINWYTQAPVFAVFCFVSAILFPILYLIWYHISVNGQIKKYGLENPRFFYSVKLSSEGIAVKNQTQETAFTWKQTYRVYELDLYYYIYITKARGYILPKRDIVCGTEDILRDIVKQYLPSIRYIDKRKK